MWTRPPAARAVAADGSRMLVFRDAVAGGGPAACRMHGRRAAASTHRPDTRARDGRAAWAWRSFSGQSETPPGRRRRGAADLKTLPLALSQDSGGASRSLLGKTDDDVSSPSAAAACPRPVPSNEKLKPEHHRRAAIEVVVDRRTFAIDPEHRRRVVRPPRVAPPAPVPAE
ncbi:hypothetical protein PVAP13_7KG235300 [Panicum virgatum]|uniref:Uncharacterized protein n=1 Tax=Panicum virgatum TaxID=38727 RepID=A0A8T0QES4_PANVG|nr:hypothetical protein PVAP13_7KG235300 [Panicum virgatum]